MKKLFFLLPIFPLIIACTPAFTRQSLDQVDPNLSFQALRLNPERHEGKIVMYGGEIIQSQIEANETWVEILQKPLDWDHRPEDADVSHGRFFVVFPGFQDPAIYAPGRKITVIGEVQGKRIEKIRDLDYSYPVLLSRESHLWQPQETSGPFFHIGIGIGTVIR